MPIHSSHFSLFSSWTLILQGDHFWQIFWDQKHPRLLIKLCRYTSLANCLDAFLIHFVYLSALGPIHKLHCMLGEIGRGELKEVVEIKTARPNVRFHICWKPVNWICAIKQHIDIFLDSFAFLSVFWWPISAQKLKIWHFKVTKRQFTVACLPNGLTIACLKMKNEDKKINK